MTNMIQNPTADPPDEGVQLLYVEVEDGEFLFTGQGSTYGRAIFGLTEPMVADESYTLNVTISDVSGGVNPRLQITCAAGGPFDLVSGENNFTARSDIADNTPSKLLIKGSGTLVTARMSGLSLTE